MADKTIKPLPQPLKYKVLVSGYMFSGHRSAGDIINLYPEQAINHLPPLGNSLILADEYVETDAEEIGDDGGEGDDTGSDNRGGADDDLSKLKKDELLAKLEGINSILADEHKIVFSDSMTKAELIALIGSE